MADSTHNAHSLVEAVLYLMVNPCPVCRHGRLEQDEPKVVSEVGTVRIVTACTNCGVTDEHRFRVESPMPRGEALSSEQPINPTGQASQIIDAVQWVTLHTQLIESSRRTPDAQEARWRLLRARQCLDEAGKFYAAEDELPPESAVFAHGSRENLSRHPEYYSRSRLIALKSRLPVATGVNQNRAKPVHLGKRPWWKFWTE